MGWESIAVVRFDLGPLLQSQREEYTKSCAGNLLLWSDLTLDPPSRSNKDSQT